MADETIVVHRGVNLKIPEPSVVGCGIGKGC